MHNGCTPVIYEQKESNSTDFEIELGKFFSRLDKSYNVRISIYTNEFDLSMFRLFFPGYICKNGYLSNSLCYINQRIDEEVLKLHKICIIRDAEKLSKNILDMTTNIEKYGNYSVLYVSSKHIVEVNEENKIIQCSYTDTLFPPTSTKNALQMTTVGLYSITPYKWNQMIVKNIIDTVGQDITILDCTACIGGDAIGFSNNFKKVIAIEKEDLNFQVLKNNVEQYKRGNIDIFHGDFIEKMKELMDKYNPDVLYSDPAWQGKDYILEKKMNLFLNDINIKDLIKNVFQDYPYVKLFVLKVPKNYDYTDLPNYNKLELKKFDVLLIKKD